jgi:F-type H+-transporting ATPase subunit epsilon
MIRLEIVTPERRVLDADVDTVTVPTASGEAGIMPNHAPLISVLKPGILSYSVKGSSSRLAVSSGFVEVSSNKVAVLVDAAETADEIDIDAVKAEREAAEKAYAAVASGSIEETEPVREQLEAAQIRLQLASSR